MRVLEDYFLQTKFAGVNIEFDPAVFKNFLIVHDINRLVGTFSTEISDAQGLVHLVPTDEDFGTVKVSAGKSPEDEDTSNEYDFAVYRWKPKGVNAISNKLKIEGITEVDELFAPCKSRAWNKSIKEIIEGLAGDLGVDNIDVSDSLDYKKNIVQSYVSNLDFLMDLKPRLIGKDGEYNYQMFIKNEKGKKVFVCKSQDELSKADVVRRFVIADEAYEDQMPVYEYFIMNNKKLFGSLFMGYNYFDYKNSEFKEVNLYAKNMFSLSEFFLINKEEEDAEEEIKGTDDFGRNSDFTDDFQGEAKAHYYKRVNSLVKMWILVGGDINISVGDVVDVFFPFGIQTGRLLSCQFSGFWLVERVVQSFGKTHRTRLLLTRAGVNTDQETTLLKAEKFKKRIKSNES